MIAIFILSIISVLMAGMGAYAVWVSVQSTQVLTQVGRNVSQMDGLAALVRANIRSITFPTTGGYVSQLFAPTPQGDSLPAWLTVNARTPWGAAYRYCAYAPNPVGGAIAATASGEGLPYGSVQVHDLTSPDAGPQSYVVSGARPGNPSDNGAVPQVLAFVISPLPGSDITPTCDEISWNGSVFRAANGSVVAVTDDVSTRAGLPIPSTMVRFATAAGGGDGGSIASPATLSDALAEWKATRPVAAVVTLSSDVHNLAPSELDLSSFAGGPIRMAGHSLRLIGQGAGATTLASSGGAGPLATDADLSIEGITMAPGVSLWAKPGAHVRVYGTNLRYVFAEGSDVLLDAGTQVVAVPADATGLPGRAAIDANGGHLVIRETASYKPIGGSMPYAISLNGGVASFDGTELRTSGTSSGIAWLQLSGGGRFGTVNPSSIVTYNGTSATFPVAFGAGDQRIVETSCTGTPCVAQCMAGGPPITLGKSWFASSGSCEANAVADGVVVITQSGALANASNLPTDWQCKFAVASIGPDPAPNLPSTPGTARAICSEVPSQ
ncbi:hypothetical protein ACVIGB_000407 [Bradyrhizobium sp. USDA 4341]